MRDQFARTRSIPFVSPSSCLATVVALAALIMLSGCNTVAGAGQDVSSAGHSMTNAAQKAAP